MGLPKPSGSAKNRRSAPTLIRSADIVDRLGLAGSEGHDFQIDNGLNFFNDSSATADSKSDALSLQAEPGNIAT